VSRVLPRAVSPHLALSRNSLCRVLRSRRRRARRARLLLGPRHLGPRRRQGRPGALLLDGVLPTKRLRPLLGRLIGR